ncbi:MAG: protein-L-isoaspartate(D-aspartate) O-methyltransferase [Candidatus Omnitrophota bacterium]
MRELKAVDLRDKMVDEQLIPKGIRDGRVLNAFRKALRHLFIPGVKLEDAYGDYPLTIGERQTISQPYITALMTQCLELKGAERVLEIGTGSGYQTSILAELSSKVYSVEKIESLAKRAQLTLKDLGYANVAIRVGDGTEGWSEFAPYDRILVTAAAPCIPIPLIEQLAEGGRMVIPVGAVLDQVLILVRKEEGRVVQKEICGCVFVPLLGKYGWKE